MNVALIGYGKMGREIERILNASGDSVGLIVDRENSCDITSENLKGIDVAIEFSTPDTAYNNVVAIIKCGIPVVCGTTAWLDRLEEVKVLCESERGAFFYASNYSIGVNLMFRINKMLAKMMNSFEQYDVTLEEIHHTAKLDAPSGTAVTLADDIIDNIERKDRWVLGSSIEPTDMNVVALRRASVTGTHKVVWDSAIDEIEITHRANSRAGFAQGAVVAARFLIGKRGCFSMEDLF